jgi:hypothetical protein
VTLPPGIYVGGIQIDGQATVILSGGVYYMKGGGFEVSGQATVTSLATGPGVLLVNAPVLATDVISITGQAVVTLTADLTLPDGLAPYDGIAVFQDPASTNTILAAGNPGDPPPSLAVTGTVYAKSALLQIVGQAEVVVSAFPAPNSTVGGVVVVFQAKVDGNGELVINADPPAGGAGGLINFAGRTLRTDGAATSTDGAAAVALGRCHAGAGQFRGSHDRWCDGLGQHGGGCAAAGPERLCQPGRRHLDRRRQTGEPGFARRGAGRRAEPRRRGGAGRPASRRTWRHSGGARRAATCTGAVGR